MVGVFQGRTMPSAVGTEATVSSTGKVFQNVLDQSALVGTTKTAPGAKRGVWTRAIAARLTTLRRFGSTKLENVGFSAAFLPRRIITNIRASRRIRIPKENVRQISNIVNTYH